MTVKFLHGWCNSSLYIMPISQEVKAIDFDSIILVFESRMGIHFYKEKTMKETPFNFNTIYKVLEECDYRDKDGHKLYKVKCKICGIEKILRKWEINHHTTCNHTNRFGIYVKIDKENGKKYHRLYNILLGMIRRCYEKSCKSYAQYGEKGISICEEWLSDKTAFVEWALNNGYKEDLTIDRIDSSKGYYPENCRWVNFTDNRKYKSTTHMITVENETHTGKDWCKVLQLGNNTINRMLQKYEEDIVIQFIKARKKDMSLKLPTSNTSWLDVYNIPH